MIIDGKLVVSKKKKDVLVAELRKLNFTPFPKTEDAKKSGELEDLVKPGNDDDDDAMGDAKDYDYLLSMPIWSLTQERVEKLSKQIAGLEQEIDELIKKSAEDLWTTDLDAFIAEWEFQNAEQKKRQKKSRKAGRRDSAKLGLSAASSKRKRKDDDSDDDFSAAKKKAAPKVKKQSALTSYLMSQPPDQKAKTEPPASSGANEDVMMVDDEDIKGQPPPIVAIKKRGPEASKVTSRTKIGSSKPIPKKAAAPAHKDLSSDIDEAFAVIDKEATKPAAGARQARTAAAKKKTYALSDSEDDSNGDDMLGDVSMMVRGITGSGENSGSQAAKARPLFSNTSARPSSAHGLPRAIPSAVKKSLMDFSDEDEVDQTDYKSLVPQGSPVRPAPKRAVEVRRMEFDDEEEEDSFDIPQVKAKIVTKKAAVAKAPLVKTKPVAAAKKPEVVVKKVNTLSPSAKAYAMKLEKGILGKPAPKAASKKKVIESDSEEEEVEEDEDIANELLSDDSPAPTRPGRRAAVVATKKTAKYVDSDEDEEEESEEEEEESFVVDDDSD